MSRLALCLVFLTESAMAQDIGAIQKVVPPVAGFYSKRLTVRGIVVLAHADVSDAAIREAARRLDRQLAGAPAIQGNLARLGVQVHIIGKDQACSDLPEYRHLRGKPVDGTKTIDERGRGYGGLFASCAEENLLRLPSDRWKDHRDICMHEFAHTIFAFALDGALRGKIEAQHRNSLAAGRWKTTYAATNADEFFAELTMWYFGTRGDYGKLEPPPAEGADWLRAYDTEAYDLLDAVYRGRFRPPQLEVAELTPLPPDSEGKVRSKASEQPTQLMVFNPTAQPAKLFWLDWEGRRKDFGQVPPGSAESRRTFVGHPWLVELQDGRVVGIFVPNERIGRVTVAEPQ